MNADGRGYERQGRWRQGSGARDQLRQQTFGLCVLCALCGVLRRGAVLRNEPSFVRRTANYGGQAPNGGCQLSAISPAKGGQVSAWTGISGIRAWPCRSHQCYQCNQWSDVAVCRIAKRTLLRSPYGELRRAGPERRLSAVGFQLSAVSNDPENGFLCVLCVLCGIVGWGGFITNCETNPISPAALSSNELRQVSDALPPR